LTGGCTQTSLTVRLVDLEESLMLVNDLPWRYRRLTD
jgi:hypothetical protein